MSSMLARHGLCCQPMLQCRSTSTFVVLHFSTWWFVLYFITHINNYCASSSCEIQRASHFILVCFYFQPTDLNMSRIRTSHWFEHVAYSNVRCYLCFTTFWNTTCVTFHTGVFLFTTHWFEHDTHSNVPLIWTCCEFQHTMICYMLTAIMTFLMF